MNFIPCNQMLIVTMEEKDRTASGLYIPKTSGVEWVWGEVVAVHDGVYTQNGNLVPCEYAIGDRVMYQKLTAMLLEITEKSWEPKKDAIDPLDKKIIPLYLIREVAIGMKEKKV